MNKVRCEKCGQYYNADKFPDGCPHCKKKLEGDKTEVITQPEVSGVVPQKQEPQAEPVFVDPPMGMADAPDISLSRQVKRLSGSSGEKTESFFTSRITQKENQTEANAEARTATIGYSDETEDASEKEAPALTISRENVEQVCKLESEEEKTQSFFQMSKPSQSVGKQSVPSKQENAYVLPRQTVFPAQEPSKTETIYVALQKSAEPNVGWLVCIKGERFGECFELYAGKNSIGRNPSNRIAIIGDPGVSREQHAFILYEPKSRKYYLQPGNSSGLTYKNEELVLSPIPLQDRDKIGLNESVFMFVALCNESFSWDAIEE